jgi:hypothetical protein
VKDRCPSAEELLFLSEGELSENRAEAVRKHLATCAACRAEVAAIGGVTRAVAAPVAGVVTEGSVARLMRRIEAEPPARGRRVASVRWGAVALLGLAAAALLFVLPRLRGGAGGPDGEFAARGERASSDLWRDVGIGIFTLAERPSRLTPGRLIEADAKLVAGYRNLVVARPVYLLAFGVDSRGVVHWLYPAFEREGEDPSSVVVPRSAAEALMPTSVVLDAPSAGPMRLVSIVTSSPLHVSDVEALRGGQLELSSLRARWPEAMVSAIEVTVAGSATPR